MAVTLPPMRLIPGLTTETFFVARNPQNIESRDKHIVYISSVLNGENVVCRPIGRNNKDSLANSRNIYQSKNLAAIEITADGIFLRIHKDLRLSISNQSPKLIFEHNGVHSKPAAITGIYSQDEKGYECIRNFYGVFLQLEAKVQSALIESKKTSPSQPVPKKS